jgi:hypothetical protein
LVQYKYNPFKKSLDSLTLKDLSILRDVAEGWFIDYKQDQIGAEKIAKAMSSFANQSGGFIVFGIKESEQKTAGVFCGIANQDLDRLQVAIRTAATSMVCPPVQFEIRVLNGPSTDLELCEGRSVVIVGIPEGLFPPHIHASGLIYVRRGDSSEPEIEKDRLRFDRLQKRQNGVLAKIREFILPNQLSQSETHIPIAYLYFVSDPFFSKDWQLISQDKFIEILKESEKALGIPFDHFQSTNDGFIARHIYVNSPEQISISFRWYFCGNARVTIPLTCLVQKEAFGKLKNVPHLEDFLLEMRNRKYSVTQIVDLSKWFLTSVCALEQFNCLLKSVFPGRKTYGKIRLAGFQGRVPFISSKNYIEWIKKYGIPMPEDPDILLPSGTDPSSFEVLPESALKDTMKGFASMYSFTGPGLAALRSIGIEKAAIVGENSSNALEELRKLLFPDEEED